MLTPVSERAFGRINQKQDESVSKSDIKDWLKDLGIGGLKGPMIRGKAADMFMDTFDTNPSNSEVTLPEFIGGLPKAIVDITGQVIPPEKVDPTFAQYDHGKKGFLTQDDVKEEAFKLFKKEGREHPEIQADVAGKTAVDFLATDRQKITLEDFRTAMAEIFPVDRAGNSAKA
jgi:Ca2+-binding EF-hand superfamily protein